MSFRENLRRARSHIIIVIVLLVGGAIVVSIEDRDLSREAGKPIPHHPIDLQEIAPDSGEPR